MVENKFKDANSPVRITSSLAGDLLVKSITGEEAMGRLFSFRVNLLSENPELHFDKVVGQQVTVILVDGTAERYFNGYITEFDYAGADHDFTMYMATVRPWFWFLTRTSDCRIFQKKTVPDIIKEVFNEHGMGDFEVRLNATYREWEYCVQYRESDFNFISRLMEQEGIYYFFEHEADKHTMVLSDGIGSHKTNPGHEDINFHSSLGAALTDKVNFLDGWTTSQHYMPSDFAISDFNFKTPKVPLLKKVSEANKHASPITAPPEVYDYPGEYMEAGDGEDYVKVRMQELRCQQERVTAGGICRGISSGCLFTLKDYPRADQNKKYLVISVTHTINNGSFYSNGTQVDEVYRCQTVVMDKQKQFRSARKTPKPMVQGPQTAIVVGPSAEEIHTDIYGRVKVQFHWDRYGQMDENSSCWVRVSQLWAGAKFGAMHIPRIGQEVIVSFLEGDPDRPIITGRVYNAVNMPPYELEQNKTQSGIKSHSSKEGGPDNFNEIRMEDKIGEEELYIQAEKDENILVKNNKGETVGNNETISIGNDREENVGNDETIAVGNNRTESVGNDESLTVGNNRTRNVGVDETISIGGGRTHTVAKSESISVGENQSITIGKDLSVAVGSNHSVDVGKDQSISIAGTDNQNIGKKLVINVGDSISLKCGSSSITMKKNGDVKIDGKNLILKGSGSISVKASGTVKIKGATIAQN